MHTRASPKKPTAALKPRKPNAAMDVSAQLEHSPIRPPKQARARAAGNQSVQRLTRLTQIALRASVRY